MKSKREWHENLSWVTVYTMGYLTWVHFPIADRYLWGRGPSLVQWLPQATAIIGERVVDLLACRLISYPI